MRGQEFRCLLSAVDSLEAAANNAGQCWGHEVIGFSGSSQERVVSAWRRDLPFCLALCLSGFVFQMSSTVAAAAMEARSISFRDAGSSPPGETGDAEALQYPRESFSISIGTYLPRQLESQTRVSTVSDFSRRMPEISVSHASTVFSGWEWSRGGTYSDYERSGRLVLPGLPASEASQRAHLLSVGSGMFRGLPVRQGKLRLLYGAGVNIYFLHFERSSLGDGSSFLGTSVLPEAGLSLEIWRGLRVELLGGYRLGAAGGSDLSGFSLRGVGRWSL